MSAFSVFAGTLWGSQQLGGVYAASNTASPNNTVPVEYLAATTVAGAANVDVAVVPLGTGAFELAVPDSTAAGGNKRGANAVDLQTTRTAATQVASGAASFAAGSGNTASGTSAAAIGANNVAAATASFVHGRYASDNGRNAARVSGTIGAGATAGRHQLVEQVLTASTTGATATVLTTDGAAASTANQLVLANNSALAVNGRVIGRDTTTGDTKEWTVSALIKRGANAAATALVGTPTASSAFADSGASAWTLGVTANTTNGTLTLTVTGAGTNVIRWTGIIQPSVEVA